MAKSFLIAINSKLGTRKELTDYLDSSSDVQYWYACLPFCVFVTTELSADELFKKIDAQFQRRTGRRFIVTELGSDRQGWLPREAWRVLRNPNNPIADQKKG